MTIRHAAGVGRARQGRRAAASMAVPKISRRAEAPCGPTSGNIRWAKAAPTWIEAMAAISSATQRPAEASRGEVGMGGT